MPAPALRSSLVVLKLTSIRLGARNEDVLKETGGLGVVRCTHQFHVSMWEDPSSAEPQAMHDSQIGFVPIMHESTRRFGRKWLIALALHLGCRQWKCPRLN